MSLQDQIQSSPTSKTECKQESQKQSRITYSRDFLLSFSELDICKKLPIGFDTSMLSEFEDASASHNVFERQRITGGLSSLTSKRGEYGSSPPTRSDSLSSYSRGSHGRWDTRSSGSNDRDGDSLSEESITQDSERHYGNQSRRPWQNPEHDGLLGSGAFPRSSGYTGGISAAKVRGNSHYQLNRSSEPYHPPRPYKALPHTRRGTTDSFNDETFGSAECSSQDRAEEERKRRASFELMRKEQRKALQEKQKLFPGQHKEEHDIAALLERSEDDKSLWNKSTNRLEDNVVPMPRSDSVKCSFSTQCLSSRPLVPPGFASSIEKNLGAKSLIPSPTSEVGTIGSKDNVTHGEVANVLGDDKGSEKQSALSVDTSEHYVVKSAGVPSLAADESTMVSPSSAEVANYSFDFENPLCKTSVQPKASGTWMAGAVTDVDAEKVRSETVAAVGEDSATSILDKLFGSTLTLNHIASPSSVKQQGVKLDEDSQISASSQSSKFAHWFLDEERMPVEDLSSSKSRDLLSLIVNSDKGGDRVSATSDDKAFKQTPATIPFKDSDDAQIIISSVAASDIVGTQKPLHLCETTEGSPGVLTCEDLEQFILAEANECSSSLQHAVPGNWNTLNAKPEPEKVVVDDHASQHLLFLLQKGARFKEAASSADPDIGSSDKLGISVASSSFGVYDTRTAGNTEQIHKSDKTLTLETLFGSAFMEELQSAVAPVSAQRGSVGAMRNDISQPHGLPLAITDEGIFHPPVSQYGSNNIGNEGSPLAVSHTLEGKSDKFHGHWLGFDDTQSEGLKPGAVMGFEDRADGTVDIRLPEEESLISVGDPGNHETSKFVPSGNAVTIEELLSLKPSVEIVDKLAALNGILKDQRSAIPGFEGPSILHGPCDPVESELSHQYLHGRPASPQFHHHHVNQMRPSVHSLDQHVQGNSQIQFLGAENIHHDPHHPFPPNIIHHLIHGPGGPRFDPTHHSVLQQMHMQGNFQPPHQLQGLPRGVPPPHPINHLAGYMPELNPLQSFPLNHHRPNYGGFGMGMPGSGVGSSNHSEALERLIEMEQRGNSKQIPPIAAGPTPGIYGPELDMGFRYR